MAVGIWKVNKQEGPAIYSKGLRKVGAHGVAWILISAWGKGNPVHPQF